MAVDSQGTARSSFDLKSAQLPVMAVALRDTEVAVLTRDLAQRLADDPDFFDNDPVLIDLQHVRDSTEDIDFPKLIKALKRHRTLPVAVCGGSPAQMAAAHAAGLMPAPDAQPARAKPTAVEVREVEVIREVPVEVEVVREVPAPAPNALIVDKPLRSGQQVYARGTDLVVMAVVSYGAEVIADGNVHVYAPLRGRAVAGARGNTEARIFSTCMEPQLLSIAGNYRALETDLPKNIAGKPAQARLEGEKLVIEPMRLA
ncbi:septum site-determining protein MinC [Comamonas aquatica]|jgi:septum site-determining protein MinC|uniref:Probable septum site-determining protein MinC n=1 Tax=Comamonas aquatica TaxID=225991 RepID=A0AA35D3J5_9BURK|nr:septum site-determining protein MinC [Comamonas aquatica]CAB5657405.1 Septum site-determining protein MinC [Comamonas aquatica]CAB5661790.1 Septum site-determining protein MinC [Comamonas aquatica]CAC9185797.1 Septum site-determining protein MinC [Comamonas aquatica]CAC9677605.1 Septum site-determining protein MinC [Comamonas aquatica]